MRAWGTHQVVAGYPGGTSVRWRRVAAAAMAAALPLAIGVAAAAPASAAGGYTVIAAIAVGGGPDGVAVDPAVHTAYVTNINDDSVSVIDETSRTVTGTIGVGGGPFAVAMDATDHTAYVTNGGNGTVSVIDEATGAVTATIAVGAGPDAVAVDPTDHTVYAANGGADTVSVIDETTGAVTGTIAVGANPSAVAVDPVAHTAYVVNLAGTVSVIDETTGTVAATVPVSSDPDGVAVDTVAHTAYVTNENASTVSVIGPARPVPATWATSSRNPSTLGQSVTFAAKVDPVNGGAITFRSGTTVLCRAVSLKKVSGATYRATCVTKTLAAGRHTITAVYPGDAIYGASTGTLTQTVNRLATALTASVGLGQKKAFVLTATLTSSGHPLGGQPIAVSTGTSKLCIPKTNSHGVATCLLTAPEVTAVEKNDGAIRASYPGTTSYGPSSAATVLPGSS
jgi:YVTN family beta-propeller protein